MRHLPALTFVLALPGLVLAQPPAAAPPAAPPTDAPARPRLELSLDEAVKRALENNADIAVEKLNPEAAAQSVREVEGSYDPLLSAQVSRGSNTSGATNIFAGGDLVDTDTTIFNFGAA